MAAVAEKREESRNSVDDALNRLVVDGVCSRVLILLTGGAFLAAMALALGASNFVIGLLASIGPVTQLLQIPAIYLVEKVRKRKLLTVGFAFAGRSFLLLIAVVPFLLPEAARLPAFIFSLVAFFSLGSVSGCAFNSWIRDVVPDESFGSFFGKRMATATAVGAGITVVSAFGIDVLQKLFDSEVAPYSLLFGAAGLIGLYGSRTLLKVPEPPQEEAKEGASILAVILEPLKDQNFRRLLAFTASWNFTIIMAGAFFAVYMLERIGLSITVVVLLSVLSQITNVFFFKIWGRIADRYSNRSVLQVASPLFLLMVFLYPFTTLPERHAMTIPLLILIHIIGGIATAGFTLCAMNIAMKLAPRGRATAYVAGNAFFSGIGAALGPIVGGAIGGYFAAKRLSLNLLWFANTKAPDEPWHMSTFDVQGLDFVFLTAVLAGIVALFLLGRVEETGTVGERQVRDEVVASMRQTFASLSSVAGMRRMTYFPYEILKATGKTAASTAEKGFTTLQKPLDVLIRDREGYRRRLDGNGEEE